MANNDGTVAMRQTKHNAAKDARLSGAHGDPILEAVVAFQDRHVPFHFTALRQIPRPAIRCHRHLLRMEGLYGTRHIPRAEGPPFGGTLYVLPRPCARL